MDKLPNEILNRIFVLLPQRQKVECMCVCRPWENTIKSTCLLQTVSMTSQVSLYNLVIFLKNSPSKGKQVERFISYINRPSGPLLENISTLLPNLKYFYHFGQEPYAIHHMEYTPPTCVNDRLNVLRDYSSRGAVYHTLLSKQFVNLKVLHLDVFRRDFIDLIPIFMNVPNLKHLTLLRFQFNLYEIEQLDKNMPKLTKITFKEATLLDSEVPKDIKLNNLITGIDVRKVRASVLHRKALLIYFSKKYSNLTELVFAPEKNPDTDTFVDLSKSLAEELGTLITAQNFHLKRLTLQDELPIVSLFSKKNILFQLNALNVGLYLRSSNWINNFFSVSALSQLSSLTVQFLTDNTFGWLKSLTQLKTLKIKQPYFRTFLVDDIIQHVSTTLETLVVQNTEIMTSDTIDLLDFRRKIQLCNENNKPHLNRLKSLRNLKFTDVYVQRNVDDYISHFFPGLKTLAFRNCVFSDTNFKLPNIHLSYFEFSFCRSDSGYKCFVLIEPTKEKHLWSNRHHRCIYDGSRFFDRYDFAALPESIATSYSELPDTHHYSFTFASVKHVHMY